MYLSIVLTIAGLLNALEDANGYLKSFIREMLYWLHEGSLNMAEKVFSRINLDLWKKAELYRNHKYIEPCVVALDKDNKPIIQPSGIKWKNTEGKEVVVPEIRKRESLFPEILELHWLCKQTVLIQKTWNGKPVINRKSGKPKMMTVTISAPNILMWQGKQYELLVGGKKKDYYWPTDLAKPKELLSWINTRNSQSKNDFMTMLRRHGFKVKSSFISDIKLTKEKHPDLGIFIIQDEIANAITNETGFDINYSQTTIVFEDGSYFKGTIIKQSLANMDCGFYGGIKSAIKVYSPNYKKPEKTIVLGSKAIKMNILANYRYPWNARANAQQFTYAGIKFPLSLRNDKNTRRALRLAAIGEPGYIQVARQSMLNQISDMMHRFDVKGYAGQIGVVNKNTPAQFIIFTNNKSKNGLMKQMAFLFNPSLPVHTDIMKVMVKFIYRPEYNNVICLNTHESNTEWIDKWFIKWAGRDADGDGIILSDDIRILTHTKSVSDIKWHDTTQYKGESYYDVQYVSEAINIARDNIILNSHIVGNYDLIARRIINERPELMTWDLRVRLTKNIQMGISSIKKMMKDQDLNNPFWIYQALELDYKENEWLRKNAVDERREIVSVITEINKLDNDIQILKRKRDKLSAILNSGRGTSLDIDTLEKINASLSKLEPQLTQKISDLDSIIDQLGDDREIIQTAISDAMSLQPVANNFFNLKNIGKALLNSADNDKLAEAEGLADKIKEVWTMPYDDVDPELNELSREDALHIIEDLIMITQHKVDFNTLWGVLLSRLSSNLICQILNVEDMLKLDKVSGQNVFSRFYIPIVNTAVNILPGAILSYNQLNTLVANKYMMHEMDKNIMYRISEIKSNNYYNWVTTSRKIKTSNRILVLLPVID